VQNQTQEVALKKAVQQVVANKKTDDFHQFLFFC